MLKVLCRSEDDTERLGRLIGGLCRAGDTIALRGELGSGKTRLSAAIAAGAQIDDLREVRSPTFTLINEYPGPLKIYHCDLYRLSSSREAFDAGVEEIIGADGLCLIEWADRLPDLLPSRRIEIEIAQDAEEAQQRVFGIEGDGLTYSEIIRKIEADLQDLILVQ